MYGALLWSTIALLWSTIHGLAVDQCCRGASTQIPSPQSQRVSSRLQKRRIPPRGVALPPVNEPLPPPPPRPPPPPPHRRLPPPPPPPKACTSAENSGGTSCPFSVRILRSSLPVDLALVAVKKVKACPVVPAHARAHAQHQHVHVSAWCISISICDLPRGARICISVYQPEHAHVSLICECLRPELAPRRLPPPESHMNDSKKHMNR